jgi:hypothetical protein
MLRWLRRSPESFVPRMASDGEEFQLPDAPSNRVLRFDTAKLHAALDARRTSQGKTWRQVAWEVGGWVSDRSLMHLKKGGRTGFPHIVRVCRWLGRPTAEFVRQSAW